MSQNIKVDQGTTEMVYGEDSLMISELFYDTIQGEGVWTGTPAVFMRLSGCTLACTYCDSKQTWRSGGKFSHEQLLGMMQSFGVVERLSNGHHLVITGGSPLLQQTSLIRFLDRFRKRYKFTPFIEVENECTIIPKARLLHMVSCWNNSPKLINSGNDMDIAYQPDVIGFMSNFSNSWFKFVISDEKDYKEVEERYIRPGLVRKDRVLLMPMAADRHTLQEVQERVIEIACFKNLRYCTRLQIEVWDVKRCV